MSEREKVEVIINTNRDKMEGEGVDSNVLNRKGLFGVTVIFVQNGPAELSPNPRRSWFGFTSYQ